MGELRQRGRVWWLRYYRNGQRHEESSGSRKKSVAMDLLRIREGDIAKGAPVSARMGRLRFDEAAADVVNDYLLTGKSSVNVVRRRLDKHLLPFFGGRKMSAISTADVRAYVAARQQATEIVTKAHTRRRPDGTLLHLPERRRACAGVSNAEINRELDIVKRAFTLALQAGKLLARPHIPKLNEDNTRTGFFEPEHYASVSAHLPAALRPVVEFAYITGWRIDSEILPLQWRQIDFRGGEIRLDAGTTKNRAGRVFPMTDDLRRLLEAQREAHTALQKAGHVVPWVFWRMVATGRRGPKAPRRIKSFAKAWKTACRAAGHPGRIPHDFRRTAVRAMVRRRIPERVCMKLSGHKTRSVFDRYDIVSEGDLQAAGVQLSGLTGTEKGQTPPSAATGAATIRGFAK